MAEEKPARYEGAYVPRISQDEVDAVYEMASMQPRYDHPAPGKVVPSVSDCRAPCHAPRHAPRHT